MAGSGIYDFLPVGGAYLKKMMISSIKSNFRTNLVNLPGWRSSRKIVVFESDDWGMLRMRSKETLQKFRREGYLVDQCSYNSNDRIESDDDLKELMKVLGSTRDHCGNPAIFTLNNVVANPDFEKIRNSDFKKYFYEPFTETLNRHPDSGNVLSLYQKGIKNKVFQPQFHGREHINLRLWLRRLKDGDVRSRKAFDAGMFTVHKHGQISGRRDALDAFGNKDLNTNGVSFETVIQEGVDIFRQIWGFRSKSFIAPCFVWPSSLELVLHKNGIKYIQGTHVQRIPLDNSTIQIKRKYHYTGQKNKHGQIYLIRNVFFEPAEMGRGNCVENALKQIRLSFIYKKPAIISTHRVNYIGSINPQNREENLKLLQNLLQEILRQWPDVEFMSTDQLGKLVEK